MCGVLGFGINVGYTLLVVAVAVFIIAYFADALVVLVAAPLILGIPGLLLVNATDYFLGQNECSQYQPGFDVFKQVGSLHASPTVNPTPPPANQGMPGDAADPFTGTWQGAVTQSGLSPYPVVFILSQHDTDITGKVNYPGQSCSGTLTLKAYTSANIILREDETPPSSQCSGAQWNLYLGDNHATLSGRGQVDGSGEIIGVQFERTG